MHERYDNWYDKRYEKRYIRNASRVVLKENKNGKMLGSHALLCAHALGDTPIPSR